VLTASIAQVIDLLEFRRQRAPLESIEALLAELLWDLGPEARPLVEAMLVRLASYDESSVRPQIELMRSWLEHNPL
jgi:hypothetical protein